MESPIYNLQEFPGQWAHPHPAFSPSGRHVTFTSDRTGHSQVYGVDVSPEGLDSISLPLPRGYLCG